MFVDENSKKLIRYISNHEPSKIDGKKIYPVPYLVSSYDSNQEHWCEEYLKPYLSTLQELGLITSFHFVNKQSVQIERTALLLHFDEYQSADHSKLNQQLSNSVKQQNCPHSGSISPNNSRRQKLKSFFVTLSWMLSLLASSAAVIDFFFNLF